MRGSPDSVANVELARAFASSSARARPSKNEMGRVDKSQKNPYTNQTRKWRYLFPGRLSSNSHSYSCLQCDGAQAAGCGVFSGRGRCKKSETGLL